MPRGQLPIDQRRVALEVIHDGDRYGLYADADWESLIPTRGHGFVRVDGSYYYLSLHHQLHSLCLAGPRPVAINTGSLLCRNCNIPGRHTCHKELRRL